VALPLVPLVALQQQAGSVHSVQPVPWLAHPP